MGWKEGENDRSFTPGSNASFGRNELLLENVGDTDAAYSMVFLDRFALNYRREAVTDA